MRTAKSWVSVIHPVAHLGVDGELERNIKRIQADALRHAADKTRKTFDDPNWHAYYRNAAEISANNLSREADLLEGLPSDMNSWLGKCVERKLMKDGSLQIHCKQGLWSVSGADHAAVEKEAFHYWQQYFRDGEYDRILKSEPTTH